MQTTKKCPQCGKTFTGRSNKMYCSDKCKMAAFQSRESSTVSNFESASPAFTQFSNPSRKASNLSEESLKLQVQLRKLELEYAKQMKRMEMTDKEQQRSHEIMKLERMIALNQQQQQALFKLEDNGFGMPAAPLKALPTVYNKNVEEYEDESIEEYEEPDPYENEIEEDADGELDDEETLAPLDERLREAYCAIVQDYLDGEGAEWVKADLEEMGKSIRKLLKKLTVWMKREHVSPEDYQEMEHLESIQQNCEDDIKEIGSLGWLESKFVVLELDDDWREELKESIQ